MTGVFLELLGFVLNMTVLVLNMTVFLLQISLLPLKVTRFVHNKSGFLLNMTRGKNRYFRIKTFLSQKSMQVSPNNL